MGRGIPVWCWRPFARLSALCLAWLAVQIFVYPRAGPDHIQWLVFMIFILCRGRGGCRWIICLAAGWVWRPGPVGITVN